MRFLSVAWGALTLLLTYRLARRLTPAEPGGWWLPIGALALTAFNPTFLYLMASINSMVLATVVGAALAIALTDLATHGLSWPRTLFIGLLLGLAALIRWTLAPFLGVLIGALAVSPMTRHKPWQTALRTISMLLVMVALAAWWYLRNTALYGDPLALSVLYATWNEGRPLGAPPLTTGISLLLISYWGSFGPWGSIRLPSWVYVLFIGFTALGLIGLAWRWLAGKFTPDDKRRVFILGSISLGFFAMALISGSQSRFGVQQRWLMAAHPAAMILLALGWWHIFRSRPWPTWIHLAWSLPPFILALVSLLGFIYPAYAPPLTTSDPATLDYDTPLSVTVGNFARLIGSSSSPHVLPGDVAQVRLCWQALATPDKSYWLFVHLVGLDSERLAGIDSLPGLGTYPTVDWQPGQAHCSDWPIPIPADALPGRYTVQAGLYERESMTRLPALRPDGSPFDPPVVGTVIVDALPAPLPPDALALDADFAGLIRLRGASWDVSAFYPGSSLPLQLYWEAVSDLDDPYTVFVHLTPLGVNGPPLAQADAPPRSGLYPTDLWPVGALIPDTHVLPIPPDLPSGHYQIRIGLYDPLTGLRLPGPQPDDSCLLPTIFTLP